MKIIVEGLDEALQGLERGTAAAREASSAATGAGAARIVARARAVAPHVTGKLRGSIRSERLRDGSYTVKSGGPGVEYATIVHEDLTARHPDGEAKFIERPALAEAATIESEIEAAVDRALEDVL